MELKITLQNPKPGTAIPMDYQYFLSSWMYNIMQKGNAEYADFLHNKGYNSSYAGNKFFKLFCFSNLLFSNYSKNFEKSQFILNGDKLELVARFHIEEALETFVKGIFQGQQLSIKNGFNSMAKFDIINVEIDKVKVENNINKLVTLSPLVIGKKNAKGNDDYLSPLHEDFEELFFNNLIDKYLATGNILKPEWMFEQRGFKLLNPDNVRSKLITIKDGEKAETKVKGFTFTFEITAPPELIEIGLLGGFGKENAMGFGCCEIIKL